MSAAPAPSKKTVYVDVDEEITGIIDKVKTTKESIVALVLPKRATMLQSIVNMKLLKRAADQSDKKVVLITSESTLLPLAGTAGLFVAANLQSRPYVPLPPSAQSLKAAEVNDEPIDPNTAIGDLAPAQGTNDTTPIEIDNTHLADEDAAAASAAVAAAKPSKKVKKDKNKMVPNFQRFRVLLFGGAALLLALLIGGYWALAIAPKATVTLRTATSETATTAEFEADTDANAIDLATKTVPASNKELKKTEIEKVASSGEQDNGTKASGNVTFRNCTDDAVNIPAGTGVSSGNFTFITQSSVALDQGEFNSKSQCRENGGHVETVGVIAQKNGDQYNLSARSYTISGFSSVLAEGKQMEGGTSKVVKVVSQADIDNAKKKITDRQNAVVNELKNDLKESGYISLIDTFSSGTPVFTPSPAVGSEAPEVTVSGEVTYTMLGVKEADLKKLVEDQAKDKIDNSKQSILNYGFDDASYDVGRKSGSSTDITIKTTLTAGPEIDQNSLKKELAGKKRGDAESNLKGRPGITDARVELKPFWASKIPSKDTKVTFVVEQADGKAITP